MRELQKQAGRVNCSETQEFHVAAEFKCQSSNCVYTPIERSGFLTGEVFTLTVKMLKLLLPPIKKGNTTTEVLEIEEDDEENDGIKPPWPKGSGIAHVLPLKDPLGRLLEEADSFKEAAFIIANICSLQVASVSEPLKEHQDGCDFIRDSLLWMRRRTSFEIASVKAASDSHRFKQMQEKTKKNSEEDEDETTRKKLVLKMND